MTYPSLLVVVIFKLSLDVIDVLEVREVPAERPLDVTVSRDVVDGPSNSGGGHCVLFYESLELVGVFVGA